MAPTDFLDKLLSYYRKPEIKNEPVLSTETAILLSVSYTIIYVLPFYLFASTRPSPKLSRYDPSLIRARIRAVALSTIITTLITTYIAREKANLSPNGTLKILGWWPVNVIDIGRSLVLIGTLFLGPLFEAAIVEGRWKSWLTGRALRETFASTIGWRNFVAGPLTEETTFRSALLPLHLFTHANPTALVLTTPLYFGLAHLHHLYEARLSYPHSPLLPLILRTVLQFTYTTLFGWYAAFLFLRTGSLAAAVLAHGFANWMGLPRFWGRVEAPPVLIGPGEVHDSTHADVSSRDRRKDDIEMSPRVPRSSNLLSVPGAGHDRAHSTGRSSPAVEGRAKSRSRNRASRADVERASSGPSHAQARARAHAVVTGRLGLSWTIAYYVLLVAGAAGFWALLWRFTESDAALIDFGNTRALMDTAKGAKAVEGARRRWGW